jgi:hypothetical protein
MFGKHTGSKDGFRNTCKKCTKMNVVKITRPPEWHIDHIKPCSSFNLEEPHEQMTCFHWSNLQPLWAKDNLRKGARVE